jgi:hypothetical protein
MKRLMTIANFTLSLPFLLLALAFFLAGSVLAITAGVIQDAGK